MTELEEPMSRKKQGRSKKSKAEQREGKQMEAREVAADQGRNRGMQPPPGKPAAADPAGAAAGLMTQAKSEAPSQFAGKTVATVFGEMVWLLSQSPEHGI